MGYRGKWGLAAVMAVMALGCQWPAVPTGGELSLAVRWPMRAQVIPAETAAVAVAVFHEGQLVERSPYRVGIIGRGAGSVVYSGLKTGEYQVVAVAFARDLTPLTGGRGAGSIDTTKGVVRSQVEVNLTAAETGVAQQFMPYAEDIRRFLNPPSPSPSGSPSSGPSAPVSASPVASAPASPLPTPVPTAVPTPVATPAPAAGNGSGTGSPAMTFTGGFF